MSYSKEDAICSSCRKKKNYTSYLCDECWTSFVRSPIYEYFTEHNKLVERIKKWNDTKGFIVNLFE